MTAVPPAPDWWQDVDGRWYPPHDESAPRSGSGSASGSGSGTVGTASSAAESSPDEAPVDQGSAAASAMPPPVPAYGSSSGADGMSGPAPAPPRPGPNPHYEPIPAEPVGRSERPGEPPPPASGMPSRPPPIIRYDDDDAVAHRAGRHDGHGVHGRHRGHTHPGPERPADSDRHSLAAHSPDFDPKAEKPGLEGGTFGQHHRTGYTASMEEAANAPTPSPHAYIHYHGPPRVWLRVTVAVLVAALVTLILLAVLPGPTGPSPHRSAEAVAVDFVKRIRGGNPSSAGGDVLPTQNFSAGPLFNQNVVVVVDSVAPDPKVKGIVDVTVTACPSLPRGRRCTSTLKSAIPGTIEVTRYHHQWYVDLNNVPDCAMQSLAIDCTEY